MNDKNKEDFGVIMEDHLFLSPYIYHAKCYNLNSLEVIEWCNLHLKQKALAWTIHDLPFSDKKPYQIYVLENQNDCLLFKLTWS